MYCSNCGKQIPKNSKYCNFCGYDLILKPSNTQIEHFQTDGEKTILEPNIHFKDLFTDVFRFHTSQEAEEIFIYGTEKTTPSLESLFDNLPKPWLFSRVFIFFSVTLLLLILCYTLLDFTGAIPNIMFIGSFIMPIVLLFFFFEMNITRNISILYVLKAFLLGGAMAILFTLLIYDFIDIDNYDSFIATMLTSLIEDIGKTFIVVLLISKIKNHKYILNGVLIGGAIGAGFEAFESVSYAFHSFNNMAIYCLTNLSIESYNEVMSNAFTYMFEIIIKRGILAPGGHIVWSAIIGATVAIVLNYNEFSYRLLISKIFLLNSFICVILHFFWNLSISSLLNNLGYFKYILLTIIAWLILLKQISKGLKEISHLAFDKKNHNF